MKLGIELGERYLTMARADGDGEAVVLENAQGQRKTPLLVYLSAEGDCVVGTPAQAYSALRPDSAGRLVTTLKDCKVGARQYGTGDIFAALIGKMIGDAEEKTGEKATVTVIAVPDGSSDALCEELADAAEREGWQLVRASAAAVAFAGGLGSETQNFLVYNLGEGTLNLSFVEKTAKTVKIGKTHSCLGLEGRFFDDFIRDSVSDQLLDDETEPIDLECEANFAAMAELVRKSAECRRRLATQKEATLTLTELPAPRSFVFTQAQYEAAIVPFLGRIVAQVLPFLKSAGCPPEKLGGTLLVGEYSRISALRRGLEKVLKSGISCGPEEAVALGAARCAQENRYLFPKTTESYGLFTYQPEENRMVYTEIIPRGTIAYKRCCGKFAYLPKAENLCLWLAQSPDGAVPAEDARLLKVCTRSAPQGEKTPYIDCDCQMVLRGDNRLSIACTQAAGGKDALLFREELALPAAPLPRQLQTEKLGAAQDRQPVAAELFQQYCAKKAAETAAEDRIAAKQKEEDDREAAKQAAEEDRILAEQGLARLQKLAAEEEKQREERKIALLAAEKEAEKRRVAEEALERKRRNSVAGRLTVQYRGERTKKGFKPLEFAALNTWDRRSIRLIALLLALYLTAAFAIAGILADKVPVPTGIWWYGGGIPTVISWIFKGWARVDWLRLLPIFGIAFVAMRAMTGSILRRKELVDWHSLPVTLPILLVCMVAASVPVSAVTWLLREGPWKSLLQPLAILQAPLAFFLAAGIIWALKLLLVKKPWLPGGTAAQWLDGCVSRGLCRIGQIVSALIFWAITLYLAGDVTRWFEVKDKPTLVLRLAFMAITLVVFQMCAEGLERVVRVDVASFQALTPKHALDFGAYFKPHTSAVTLLLCYCGMGLALDVTVYAIPSLGAVARFNFFGILTLVKLIAAAILTQSLLMKKARWYTITYRDKSKNGKCADYFYTPVLGVCAAMPIFAATFTLMKQGYYPVRGSAVGWLLGVTQRWGTFSPTLVWEGRSWDGVLLLGAAVLTMVAVYECRNLLARWLVKERAGAVGITLLLSALFAFGPGCRRGYAALNAMTGLREWTMPLYLVCGLVFVMAAAYCVARCPAIPIKEKGSKTP
ncbi:MAG: Hsp70 family protein [Oscillospiraceae bacterium]